MDKIGMVLTVGCDADGNGGTVVPLAKSAAVYKGAEEIGGPDTPLNLAMDAAFRLHSRETRVPNPAYKPNAPDGQQGDQYIVTPGMPREECLVYALRMAFENLVSQQIDHNAEIAKREAAAAAKADTLEGAKTV